MDAWLSRIEQNNGIIPDNIGPNGIIGERRNGQWWGGFYGWGCYSGYNIMFHSIAIAMECAFLLSGGDQRFLKLLRSQIQVPSYDTIIPFMYAIDVDSSCYFVIIASRLHVDPQVLFDNAKIDPATGALICPSRYGANGWEYLNWNISTVSTLHPMRECITRLLLMRN